MVKPLAFKGDKKARKRKALTHDEEDASRTRGSASVPEENDDDSWVTAEARTDVAGPVVIVLPSEKPSCIACDANGKVFVSELENLVDSNPSTAEPHDVRQVWIANTVAGTEEISLKGHHGRYVS